MSKPLFSLVQGGSAPPVVPAFIEGEFLIIKRCPNCGERHNHKRKVTEHERQLVFRRRAHCSAVSIEHDEYFLAVEQEVFL